MDLYKRTRERRKRANDIIVSHTPKDQGCPKTTPRIRSFSCLCGSHNHGKTQDRDPYDSANAIQWHGVEYDDTWGRATAQADESIRRTLGDDLIGMSLLVAHRRLMIYALMTSWLHVRYGRG